MRVNDDIRLIVHRTAASLLLCYVGHHDDAYGWAKRRRIERHPTTGAAQLVELPERVEYIAASAIAETAAVPKPLLFAKVADDALLCYGVPPEWLGAVRRATEDTLIDIAEHLPQEAAEALLNLATGSTPAMPERMPVETDPFAYPDAQRRFRVLTNVEELERALDYPWTNGRCSCTRRSAGWSSATTMVPPGSAAVPGPARPSSHCTAPLRWRGANRKPVYC